MKTFVVRLFVPADSNEVEAHTGREVQGLVEEVGSDRRASFRRGQELLAFLGRRGDEEEVLPEAPPAPGAGA